jgi:predicted glutamine amidotransferase
MCGIMGIVGKLDRDKTISFMSEGLVALSSRGEDSTGMWHSRLGGLKGNMSAKDFIKYDEVTEYIERISKIKEPSLTLGHCRAETHGSSEFNKNNHPIYSKNWVLIHNGTLDIDDVKGYKYKGDTDSERFLSLVETSKRRFYVDRIKEAIDQSIGTLAFMLVHRKTKNLFLFREGRPLVAGLYKNKTILLSSTSEILYESINEFNKSFFKGIEVVSLPECEIMQIEGRELVTKAKATTLPDNYYYGYGNRYNTTKKKTSSATTSAQKPKENETELGTGLKDATKLHCTKGTQCVHLGSAGTFCNKVGCIKLAPGDTCKHKVDKIPKKVVLLTKSVQKLRREEETKFKLGKTYFKLVKVKDKYLEGASVLEIHKKGELMGEYKDTGRRIYGIDIHHQTVDAALYLQRKLTQAFYPVNERER